MAKQPRDDASGQEVEAETRPEGETPPRERPAPPPVRILKRDELETLRSRLQKKFH
jgi:hypothetical protein